MRMPISPLAALLMLLAATAPADDVPRRAPTPRAPESVEELTERFLAAEPSARGAWAGRLAMGGPAGLERALELVSSEPPSAARRRLLAQLTGQARASVIEALRAGDHAAAAGWLERLAGAGDAAAARDRLALVRLAGAEAAASAPPADGARRRWDALRAGEWVALSREVALDDSLGGLALRALAARRMDWREEASAALAELEMRARERPAEARSAAGALVLLGEPSRARRILEAAGELQPAFELAAAEGLHAEALELTGRADTPTDPDRARAHAVASARLRAALGEPEVAARLLDDVAIVLEDHGDVDGLAAVARQARLLGLETGAAGAFEATLAATSTELPRAAAPGRRLEAEALWAWSSLGAPDVNGVDRWRRVQELLDPDAPRQLVAEAVASAWPVLAAEPRQARWLPGLARLAESRQLDDLALQVRRAWAETSRHGRAWIELGEALAARGRWDEAEAAHVEAASRTPSDPVPVALWALAVRELGRGAEAEELMRLASLLPLADAPARHRLASALERHGAVEEAAWQRELLLELADPASWAFGASLQRVGSRAACSGDPAAAEPWLELARAQRLLQGRALDPRAASCLARQHRGAALDAAIAARDADRALLAAEGTLDGWLADVDRVADVALALDAEGRQAEGDALIARVARRLAATTRDFPRAASRHNALAWLLARSRRDLGTALWAAERAVLLAPDRPGYRDTLAEVRFQLGDAEGALGEMERALALAPESAYLRAQAERMRAGDPLSDPPRSR